MRNLDDRAAPASSDRYPPLYQFVTELRIGIHISLMRDVMGPSFTPTRIAVTSPVAETRLTQELVSCPVLIEQPSTQIVLDTAWLDKRRLWATARRVRRYWRSATAFSWNSAGAAASRAGSERFCSRTLPTDRISKLSRSACQNKAASAAAEPVERRGGAKENADLQSTVRTQSREAVSQAQARIREAVTRNRQWPEKRFLVTIQGGSPVR